MKWAPAISYSNVTQLGIDTNLQYLLYATVSRITELKYALDSGHRVLGQLNIARRLTCKRNTRSPLGANT